MNKRAGTVPSARGVAPSASLSSRGADNNSNNNVIPGFATLDKQQSMGAAKPTVGANTGAAAARSPVVKAAKAAADATTGRRTLTLSSSDHEGRPQQIVVLEASITSDATINSSERSSLCSDDDGDDDDDDDVLNDEYGAHSLLLDEIAECDDVPPRSAPGGSDSAGGDGLLVKPMNKRLPVCPVDDLAVEEEKRLRRSRHQQQQHSAKGGKGCSAPAKKRSCGDTDSLPTPHSTFTLPSRNEGSGRSNSAGDIATTTAPSTAPLGPPPAQPVPFTRRNSSPGEMLNNRSSSSASLSSPRVATGGPTGGTLPTVTPLLRKDSMAIRRQYWSQLGFSLSRSDLEKSTGRTRVRREGLRVRLNDAKSDRGDVSSFFQFIRSWYGSRDASDDKSGTDADRSDSATSGGQSTGQRRSALARTSASRPRSSSVKRGVQFHEEAELFYIPLHSDYSKRQRDCMWPTRSEFISMVERNLDQVYEEMEREYEEQLAAEEREMEEMRREEQRQRAVEKAAAKEVAQRQRREAEERAAKQAKQAAQAAAIAAMTSPPLSHGSRSPPGSSSGSLAVPTLSLTQTEVKVVPRARSSHEIRFKYLRHLGINS